MKHALYALLYLILSWILSEIFNWIIGCSSSLFSYNISLYDCCSSFIHPTIYGCLGCFQILTHELLLQALPFMSLLTFFPILNKSNIFDIQNIQIFWINQINLLHRLTACYLYTLIPFFCSYTRDYIICFIDTNII